MYQLAGRRLYIQRHPGTSWVGLMVFINFQMEIVITIITIRMVIVLHQFVQNILTILYGMEVIEEKRGSVMDLH